MDTSDTNKVVVEAFNKMKFGEMSVENKGDAREKPDNERKENVVNFNDAGSSGTRFQKSEGETKLGHRRVRMSGEVTYKKIQTSQIMSSIQLGIQHTVKGLPSKPERDLLMQDFMTVETTTFAATGSSHTPTHHYTEFKFKNYAPIAFRYFRDLFGIQPSDFLTSFCKAPLRELSNPGASGSIFYLTDDDEFIIKTIQHSEGEFLEKLLPGYYMNLNQNPKTLLPKFFGLYCYQCNSKNIRMVAMNNLLPSCVLLHQKYDLKGSTYKRKASKLERQKELPTFKDLDFLEHHSEGLFLEGDIYNTLVKTIQRDCRVLESFKIMDYSLLVGIHNLDQAEREKVKKHGDQSRGDKSMVNRTRSIHRHRIVAHSSIIESIQAESGSLNEDDNIPHGGIHAKNAVGERLLLFIGIIDILQSYRLKKKLEHTWKSFLHDGNTVSVHRPGFYAQRFQDFVAKTVFKKLPSPVKYSPSKRQTGSRPIKVMDTETDCLSSCSTPPPAFEDAVKSVGYKDDSCNGNRNFDACTSNPDEGPHQFLPKNFKDDIQLEPDKENKLSTRVGSDGVMVGTECDFTCLLPCKVEGSSSKQAKRTPTELSSFDDNTSCSSTPEKDLDRGDEF